MKPETADERSRIDALLSMLVDGELDAQEESKLRERIAREPALAERLAAFERVGDALRALPTPAVPADLAVRMRAKLAEQQRRETSPATTATARAARRPRRAPPRRSRRVWAAAAGLSAAAAALALYLVLPSGVPLPSPEVPEAQRSLLASAGEDELGIALYYDELVDLELLEQFELLEILAAIEQAEQG